MQLNNAIIGSTGFIGANLRKIHQTSHLYNSKNISSISGLEFNTIFCAAPGAAKWKINKNPKEDLNNIIFLLKYLQTVNCKKFILYSTIDVHTSKTNPSYGSNRLFFEKELYNMFEQLVICRLPGLYGPGLKKNIIYDLLNNRCEFVNINSAFQWLNVETAIKMSLKKPFGIHEFYPEPLETSVIVKKYFPSLKNRCVQGANSCYNFIPDTGYIMPKSLVLEDIGKYVTLQKKHIKHSLAP